MEKKDQYTFDELVCIIKELRSEHGCPWDKEQTHESLQSCLQEEAAEVLAAIRKNDMDNLCEELGDVLLQVLLHSQIASENGSFTLGQVINGISTKMIRRHPHVFGSAKADNAGEVLTRWEEIKRLEGKGKEGPVSELGNIPEELSGLARSQKVLKKADKLGMHPNNWENSMKQAQKLLGELQNGQKESEGNGNLYGKLLLEISNLARISKIEAELELHNTLEGYISRIARHNP